MAHTRGTKRIHTGGIMLDFKNLPFKFYGFKFSILNNPRKSRGELGDEDCCFCGAHVGAFFRVEDEMKRDPNFTHANICKGCLYDIIQSIDKEILNI